MPIKGISKTEHHFVLQTIRNSRTQTPLSGNNATMEHFQCAAKEVCNAYEQILVARSVISSNPFNVGVIKYLGF